MENTQKSNLEQEPDHILVMLKPKQRQKIFGFIQDRWIKKYNEFGML